MTYLDYSATTPVRTEVLDSFCRTCKEYIGNANSLHQLGVSAHQLEQQATKQIAHLLGVKPEEVIYTSGASESNNLALKGLAYAYPKRGKQIITTHLEHSSIYGPLSFLEQQGYTISFVKTDASGLVDLEDLKELLKTDTLLVSIASVNSETGLRQPVEQIGSLIHQSSKSFFHVDMTQSIGKISIPFDEIDLASFSAHKFYGLKGIGGLIKKEKIKLEPLIHGGASTTIYRSGTPALPLIVSLSKALRCILEEQAENLVKVTRYQATICKALTSYEGVTINHNECCIPHILNISVLAIKPETLLHGLEQDEVYISTQSACSSHQPFSKAVFELTKDRLASEHSVRISLSGHTTEEEITTFLASFDRCYRELRIFHE